ncbi:threonine/serine exporter family protein [Vibrio sp. FNV 38]|nr:threonine/serine exporter family protein [Vibrio sp. FNV 38]
MSNTVEGACMPSLKTHIGSVCKKFNQDWDFIVKVGKAAHQYGSTSTRLERYLVFVANHLGYCGRFKVTPNTIIFSLQKDSNHQPRIEKIQVDADMDLYKLAQLGELLTCIERGQVSIREASASIDEIKKTQPQWNKKVVLLGYILVAFGLPSILGGSWLDSIIAPIFSVIVYLMVLLCGTYQAQLGKWLPLLATFVTSVLTGLSKVFLPELDAVLVIVSASAIILPGYTISVGIAEMISRRVTSGAKNLCNGLSCMLKMVLGSWLGIILTTSFAHPASDLLLSAPVDRLWFSFTFPLLMVGLCFTIQTPKRDFIWVNLVSIIAFVCYLAGGDTLGVHFGALSGVFVSIFLANRWSNHTGYPSSIVLVPVVIMLVSGTIGYRGLLNITEGAFSLGFQQTSQTFSVAIALLFGTVAANVLTKPKATL